MRLNEFCRTCSHKLMDKNVDKSCKRCAGTHIYSNYLFYESEGCEHCNEGVKIGDEFYVEISGNLLKGGYDDIEINCCPICGRKLN